MQLSLQNVGIFDPFLLPGTGIAVRIAAFVDGQTEEQPHVFRLHKGVPFIGGLRKGEGFVLKSNIQLWNDPVAVARFLRPAGDVGVQLVCVAFDIDGGADAENLFRAVGFDGAVQGVLIVSLRHSSSGSCVCLEKSSASIKSSVDG